MEEINWIEYLTAFGSVTTPILVLLLSAIGWRIRTRLERKMELEDKLRDDRIEAYNKILEPFIILLMTDQAWKADPKNRKRDKNKLAQEKMLSLDYKEQAFKLSLVGSDSVVKSYNNLMQYFYSMDNTQQEAKNADPKIMMSLLGKFLLEIRKSMGNQVTSLDNWDMLEWFLTDARKYRDG
ncbi:hypothetical protein [Rhodohalobacter sulfatireducens]|uniref:DUF4760 domain-containing protein n=1 Tax=Rhodohalobacter sulfatireducens TaxID=2911366 RepID=A0ABS9KBC9_9BACT|nr:hypothetical protein [Rhodohalobacter sulfatireducens]MCG2588138.1 hypothetical protein [Rhodohalobacter sulfatireducens]